MIEILGLHSSSFAHCLIQMQQTERLMLLNQVNKLT